jgi:hypothetical protein
MKAGSKLSAVGIGLRASLAVSALGYLAWRLWQQRNRKAQAVWAAGTDTISERSTGGQDG